MSSLIFSHKLFSQISLSLLLPFFLPPVHMSENVNMWCVFFPGMLASRQVWVPSLISGLWVHILTHLGEYTWDLRLGTQTQGHRLRMHWQLIRQHMRIGRGSLWRRNVCLWCMHRDSKPTSLPRTSPYLCPCTGLSAGGFIKLWKHFLFLALQLLCPPHTWISI